MHRTLVAACAGVAFAASAGAASKVSIEIGGLEFEGLAIEDLSADLAPPSELPGSVRLKAARIRGVSATGPLSGFSLECQALRIEGDVLSCERGRLSGSLGSLGVQDTQFKAQKLADGSLKLGFESFAIAGGRGRLDLDIEGSRWRMESDLAGLDLEKLASVAKPWVALPEGLTVAGSAGGRFRATGSGDTVATANAEVALESLDFSDAAGTLAGEKLSGTVRIDATADETSRLPARGRITLVAGQAYSDPVFLDFAAHRAELDFAGTLDTEKARFEADTFTLDHADVMNASGQATVDFAGDMLLPAARIRIESLDLANALPAYVQPFLIDSAFKDITGAGTIKGDVEIDSGLPTRAELDLESVTIDSAAAAVSLEGLNGRVNWFDDASRTALAGTIDDDCVPVAACVGRGATSGVSSSVRSNCRSRRPAGTFACSSRSSFPSSTAASRSRRSASATPGRTTCTCASMPQSNRSASPCCHAHLAGPSSRESSPAAFRACSFGRVS